MLSEEQKNYLSKKITDSFSGRKTISQNDFLQFLKENQINYKSYGFSKFKSFLKNIPGLKINEEKGKFTISISTDKNLAEENVKKDMIQKQGKAIKKDHSASKRKTKAEGTKVTKTDNENQNKKKTNRNDFAISEKDIFIPNNIYQCLQVFSITEYNETFFRKLILESLKNSISKKQSSLDYFIFPLPLKNYNGETIFIGIKNSSIKPYKYYVYYVGTTKEKPGDVLMNMVHFDDFDNCMNKLSDLCLKEPWCFKDSKDPYLILKIYFQYTFYTIKQQNKLAIDPKHQIAIFNTGLMDKNHEDIYCVLKMKNKEFHYFGFSTAGSESMGKMIVCLFPDLPEKATYFNRNTCSFLLEPELALHIDYQHILIDNISRFPIDFLETIFSPFKDLMDIVKQIKSENNCYKKNNIYQELKKKISKNSIAFNLMKSYFDGAVKTALKIASHDYRYVIPSYFSTNNTLSLMLPIILDETKGPQLVLLLEKVSAKSYQGQTILDLKQCYVNARLIGPTTYTFLNANLIED